MDVSPSQAQPRSGQWHEPRVVCLHRQVDSEMRGIRPRAEPGQGDASLSGEVSLGGEARCVSLLQVPALGCGPEHIRETEGGGVGQAPGAESEHSASRPPDGPGPTDVPSFLCSLAPPMGTVSVLQSSPVG